MATRTRRTTTVEVDEPTRQKALVVHERLCAAYGCPIAFFHDLDPLSELELKQQIHQPFIISIKRVLKITIIK